MTKGAYIIDENKEQPYDIVFSIKPEVNLVPEEQSKLHSEIERTLIVLRKLFEDDTNVLDQYFRQVLTLAQAGLVPDNAQPAISLTALQQLKLDVIERKSGEVKNTYFKKLGILAFQLAIIPLILGLTAKLLYYYYPAPDEFKNISIFSNFLFLWTSSMVGIWLSFGARKTTLSFEELITIEEDRLEPLMRLIFAGLITLVFALLFYREAISIKIGSVSSTNIGRDVFTAMIFGVFFGLSEQVLGKKITKRAAAVVDNL